ncbi:hypothetical protein KI387_030706, partial [Taxus chinensis]
MGGCDAIGIYKVAGADEAMLKVVDEGMVDTMGETDVKSVTDVIGVVDIDDVGSSWDTTGGKVEEGKAELVLADAEVGRGQGGWTQACRIPVVLMNP